jgi:hypothetical protein
MKRYGNLYQKICEYDNVKTAHEKAKRDKSHYSAVKRVNASLNEYLSENTVKPLPLGMGI